MKMTPAAGGITPLSAQALVIPPPDFPSTTAPEFALGMSPGEKAAIVQYHNQLQLALNNKFQNLHGQLTVALQQIQQLQASSSVAAPTKT